MGKTEIISKKSVCVEINDIVLPGYTNMYHTLFGGKLMEMIDKAAAICATRYCHELVVTASVEAIDFHVPIKVGYFVKLVAKVIFVGNSSMMIRVNVWGEEPLSGKNVHCCTAFVNMVAIDSNGNKVRVPGLITETEQEIQDLNEALEIRKSTLHRRENRRKT
ncbi:MAG: acyl-CoA thioesterase [Spirochaetales bacterium]|nr:acyl-CoA thioesterase [Spirochaetales bacterium]